MTVKHCRGYRYGYHIHTPTGMTCFIDRATLSMTHTLSVSVDASVSVVIALVAGGTYIAAGRAQRTRSYGHVVAYIARILEADIGEIASILGTSRHAVEAWLAHGMPAAWHPQVARLLRAAVALRRALPPDTARRLLALRQRRKREDMYADFSMPPRVVQRQRRAGDIIITVRSVGRSPGLTIGAVPTIPANRDENRF